LTIIHRDAQLLEAIETLEGYVKTELNVKEVRYERDESKFIELYAKPNFPVLGKRLGKRMKEFQPLIAALTPAQIEDFQNAGAVELGGETFSQDEIQVFREAKTGTNAISDRLISIDLVCDLNEELVLEGFAREVVNRVQRTRRETGLDVSDRIAVTYSGDARLLGALAKHKDYVAGETLAVEFGEGEASMYTVEIDGERLTFDIRKVEK